MIIYNYSKFILESIDNLIYGKNIFKSFLKINTSLGFKDIKPNWKEIPEDFLIFYKSPKSSDIVNIISRFKSLNVYSNKLDRDFSIFYGIKLNMMFEYGFIDDNSKIIVGQFKITSSNLKWILFLNSPSISSFKRELINLDVNKILLLCKIKLEMKKFNPGVTEERSFFIKDDIITFSYNGLGRWDHGKLDKESLDIIRDSFRNFLSKYKWHDKIKINISFGKFWIYLNIKIK